MLFSHPQHQPKNVVTLLSAYLATLASVRYALRRKRYALCTMFDSRRHRRRRLLSRFSESTEKTLVMKNGSYLFAFQFTERRVVTRSRDHKNLELGREMCFTTNGLLSDQFR
jgi:hypothetical protein